MNQRIGKSGRLIIEEDSLAQELAVYDVLIESGLSVLSALIWMEEAGYYTSPALRDAVGVELP